MVQYNFRHSRLQLASAYCKYTPSNLVGTLLCILMKKRCKYDLMYVTLGLMGLSAALQTSRRFSKRSADGYPKVHPRSHMKSQVGPMPQSPSSRPEKSQLKRCLHFMNSETELTYEKDKLGKCHAGRLFNDGRRGKVPCRRRPRDNTILRALQKCVLPVLQIIRRLHPWR